MQIYGVNTLLLFKNKSLPLAGYEATEWPTDVSPWPSAMGKGNPTPTVYESRRDDRNNFELRIFNCMGSCKLA